MSDAPDLRDLPTLDAWADRLRDAAEREERRTDGRRLPMRRMTLVMMVMLLVVPGAVATRSIWVDPVDRLDPARDPNSTPAVELATGRLGDFSWTVGGFLNSSGRCVQLRIQGTVATSGACSGEGPAPARIMTATAVRGDVEFVFGTVSPAVEEVRVTVAGGRSLRVEAVEPDADALRRARMPAVRVYVAAFRGGFDATHTPVVVAYDADGKELGRQPEERRG